MDNMCNLIESLKRISLSFSFTVFKFSIVGDRRPPDEETKQKSLTDPKWRFPVLWTRLNQCT